MSDRPLTREEYAAAPHLRPRLISGPQEYWTYEEYLALTAVRPHMFKGGLTEADALHAIVDLLDGVEWTPDTLDRIAEILRAAGYTIRDLEGNDVCGAESVDGYRCTLDAGHTGDHVATRHPMEPTWRRG